MERFQECLGFKKPGAQASCRPVPYNFLSARRAVLQCLLSLNPSSFAKEEAEGEQVRRARSALLRGKVIE